MGLTAQSFHLSDDQIVALNKHFSLCKEAYLSAGEEIGTVSIKVEFEWVPGLGRFVTGHFDGERIGCEVEEAGYPKSNWS